jgi:rubrerythrin
MVDVEVLRFALGKEEEAIKIYQDMIISNPGVKDLLYQLVTEEQKHKILIEKRIAELTR